MTRKDNVARPRTTAHGKAQAVGAKQLDDSTTSMLGIKPDAQVLFPEGLELVQHIKETCDLTDFTPMNRKYGPMSVDKHRAAYDQSLQAGFVAVFTGLALLLRGQCRKFSQLSSSLYIANSTCSKLYGLFPSLLTANANRSMDDEHCR